MSTITQLPEEALLRLCGFNPSPLYLACRTVCSKVRRATKFLTIRYLHDLKQIRSYPSVSSVKVHSIDLRSHSLGDYLPSTVTDLSLLNVSLTSRLFSLIPEHVISLELNMSEAVFALSEMGHRPVYRSSTSWVDSHQEYNLESPDYSLLHQGLRKLRIGSMNAYGDKLGVTKRGMVTVDLDREGGDDTLPDTLEEWYDADLVTPSKGHISTNLRVVCADRISIKDDTTLADMLPNLESFRLAQVCECGKFFSVLPSSLTDLRVDMDSTPELMATLKKSRVTSLAMKKVNTKLLWEGLKELRITYHELVTISLADLPRSLRHFQAQRLHVASVGEGWPQLESLGVMYYQGEYSSLPKTIHTLCTNVVMWKDVRNDGLRPVSLSLCNFNGDDTTYVHSLPDSITILQVYYANLYEVPSSVKHLSLRTRAGFLPPLPEGLLTLTFESPLVKFVPSLIEALPRSLQELDLDESKLGLNCAPFLPPRLVRLGISDWEGGNATLLSLPKSLAVLQAEYAEMKDINEERHPALCHAYGMDLEQ